LIFLIRALIRKPTAKPEMIDTQKAKDLLKWVNMS
jgi:hypothetical protein